ncbi:GGDEF domain-containing protein [Roseateles sp.]|uniref:GGDEF domain-containing protein n=1 Tax=Roseateles sp. TaxID=1971397 RepID=UPI0039393DC5
MSQSTTTLSSLEDEDDGNARRLTSLRLRISLAVPAVVFVVVLAFEALQLGSLGSALGEHFGLVVGLTGVLSAALLALLEHLLLRPLRQLARGIEALETGPVPLGAPTDPLAHSLTAEMDRIRHAMQRAQDSIHTQDQDVRRLQRELDHQREALDSANAQLAAQNRELASLSRNDNLTGLLNRTAFEEALRREFKRAQRQRGLLALAVLDLDDFKRFNQTHGAQTGDAALKRVALLLAERFKRDTDIVARLSGEEFVVLLPGCSVSAAQGVLESVRSDVRSLRVADGGGADETAGAELTVSVGLAAMSPSRPYLSAQAFLQAADEALYMAKHAGRDRLSMAA